MRELLIEAKEEILRLRRRNDVLEAQVGVLEVFAVALGMRRGERGDEVDVAWRLQQKINELNKGVVK